MTNKKSVGCFFFLHTSDVVQLWTDVGGRGVVTPSIIPISFYFLMDWQEAED